MDPNMAFDIGVAQAQHYDRLLRNTMQGDADAALELFYLARRRGDARCQEIAKAVCTDLVELRSPTYFALLERSCAHGWKLALVHWLTALGSTKAEAIRAVRMRWMPPISLTLWPWPDPEELMEDLHDETKIEAGS